MECPIKVNRHKGGRVEVYICGSVGSSVPGGLGSNPVRAWNFLSSFLLLVKLQLACDDQCFFFISHRQLQRNYYCLQIHNLNLRKEENLCFDNILFVNDWRIINKISLSDLTKFPQSGKGRWECLFRAFIVWKKVRIDYLFSNDSLR